MRRVSCSASRGAGSRIACDDVGVERSARPQRSEAGASADGGRGVALDVGVAELLAANASSPAPQPPRSPAASPPNGIVITRKAIRKESNGVSNASLDAGSLRH